ncbi:MAG: ABC transporter permease [Treponema sp.]|nr:ABC transporter permease [Treponema sp.]
MTFLNSLLSAFAYSCPLILCSLGALFSEFAGCLALFLDGLVSFSAFLFYTFTVTTGSPLAGAILTCLGAVVITLVFSAVVELGKANRFIAAIAMNLLFGALTSCFSWAFFGTRGVLAADFFMFSVGTAHAVAVCCGAGFVAMAVIFLKYSRHGLYVRIAGSDADVLKAKGVNPGNIKSLSWCLSALYGSLAGILLAIRLSSFVPNISSGRGWMALAAVFLGKKKPLRIVAAVLIFCFADLLAANIQNYIPGIPSSFLISLPYLVSLILILAK